VKSIHEPEEVRRQIRLWHAAARVFKVLAVLCLTLVIFTGNVLGFVPVAICVGMWAVCSFMRDGWRSEG
jgi:hypothetical protein